MVSKDLSDGPLTGLKVLDMTVAVQGPHVGAFLSDMGAEVIKVEPPGGELNRYGDQVLTMEWRGWAASKWL